MTDLEQLVVEMDTNFVRDVRGRILGERVPEPVPGPHLVVASARQGRACAVSAGLPEVAARRLETLVATEPAVTDPAIGPAHAERYLEVITEVAGPVVAGGVPCFVIEPASTHRPPPVPGLVCSIDPESGAYRPLLPPGHADERRGPWAAVVEEGGVVSLCSTARRGPGGAEAGTWTDYAHRGRGYASAATAAWAAMLSGSGRTLFYCTDEWNLASQGVAARMGFRPIGWLWKVVPATEAEEWARQVDESDRSRADRRRGEDRRP